VFIFEQTDDVATRELWFHEFLSENPALFDDVGYAQMQAVRRQSCTFQTALSQTSSRMPDRTLASATWLTLPREPLTFENAPAESLRQLFGDVAPDMLLEISHVNSSGRMRVEIVRREGLALLYETSMRRA
jgi:hypothetical protein